MRANDRLVYRQPDAARLPTTSALRSLMTLRVPLEDD